MRRGEAIQFGRPIENQKRRWRNLRTVKLGLSVCRPRFWSKRGQESNRVNSTKARSNSGLASSVGDLAQPRSHSSQDPVASRSGEVPDPPGPNPVSRFLLGVPPAGTRSPPVGPDRPRGRPPVETHAGKKPAPFVRGRPYERGTSASWVAPTETERMGTAHSASIHSRYERAAAGRSGQRRTPPVGVRHPGKPRHLGVTRPSAAAPSGNEHPQRSTPS